MDILINLTSVIRKFFVALSSLYWSECNHWYIKQSVIRLLIITIEYRTARLLLVLKLQNMSISLKFCEIQNMGSDTISMDIKKDQRFLFIMSYVAYVQ